MSFRHIKEPEESARASENPMQVSEDKPVENAALHVPVVAPPTIFTAEQTPRARKYLRHDKMQGAREALLRQAGTARLAGLGR